MSDEQRPSEEFRTRRKHSDEKLSFVERQHQRLEAARMKAHDVIDQMEGK